MIGYTKINLKEMSEMIEPEKLQKIISDFSCPYNKDVEYFFHEKALEFSRQGLASTFLVFASYKGKPVLVGYFSLTTKYFHIGMGKGLLSSKLRKRIKRFLTILDENSRIGIVTAPLIAQLGKNYADSRNELITGEELLKIACDTVQEGQRILGGKIVYLECEDVPSLLRFYTDNGFCQFGRRMLDGDETDKLKGNYLLQMLKFLT